MARGLTHWIDEKLYPSYRGLWDDTLLRAAILRYLCAATGGVFIEGAARERVKVELVEGRPE